jgi:hypothetical protein
MVGCLTRRYPRSSIVAGCRVFLGRRNSADWLAAARPNRGWADQGRNLRPDEDKYRLGNLFVRCPSGLAAIIGKDLRRPANSRIRRRPSKRSVHIKLRSSVHKTHFGVWAPCCRTSGYSGCLYPEATNIDPEHGIADRPEQVRCAPLLPFGSPALPDGSAPRGSTWIYGGAAPALREARRKIPSPFAIDRTEPSFYCGLKRGLWDSE